MMKINVDKINEVLKLYNSKIEKYDDLVYNYYNNLEHVFSDSEDKNIILYLDKINSEKQDIKQLMSNIKQVGKLYDYIYTSYSTIGSKIKYSPEFKDKIKYKTEAIINNLDRMILEYNDIITLLKDENATQFEEQKNKLVTIKKDMFFIKNTLFKTLNSIQNIEENINKQISNINIKPLKETNVEDYMR